MSPSGPSPRTHVPALLAVMACLMPAAISRAAGTTAPAMAATLPTAAAQQRALSLVRDIFKDDYARIAAADRRALARKLFQRAAQTHDDLAARYVLLREARDLASGAGDGPGAMTAVEEMARWFAVDVQEIRLAALTLAVRYAEAGLPQQANAWCCLDAAHAAVEHDDFDGARRFCLLAETAAARSRRQSLVALTSQRMMELRDLTQEHQAGHDALGKLQDKPMDPEARLIAGRFLCFNKGNWDRGLELLSRCNDPTLQSLAQRELLRPDDPAALVDLAHGWWNISQQHGGMIRNRLQDHAAQWYAAALPRLTGLTQASVEKRLEEIEQRRLRDRRLEPGLAAELFAATDFSRLVTQRVDSQISFNWGKGAAAEGMPKDDFSIRWTGMLRIATGGRYTFIVYANSGARLTVADNVLIDSPNVVRRRNGERVAMDLKPGLYPLQLEFWDGGGEASVKLEWMCPGSGREEVIPARWLYHQSDN